MSRSSSGLFLTAGGIGAALSLVLWSGFPFRVGLTKAEARLSLPGDLIVPVAAQVGDRAKSFAASPADLYPGLLSMADIYQEVWGRRLEMAYEETNSLLVWKTEESEPGAASLAACLLPAPDGRTVVHVRERYLNPAPHHLFATAMLVPVIWPRLRASALNK